MPQPSLKERIEEADKKAVSLLENLKNPTLSEEAFYANVKEFLLCKYFLEPEEYTTENISELAELSIEKMLWINDKSIKLAQGSNTCTNQSSTDIKKVLLSLTLQRALGVKLTPHESADIETIPDLAYQLYRRLYPQKV